VTCHFDNRTNNGDTEQQRQKQKQKQTLCKSLMFFKSNKQKPRGRSDESPKSQPRDPRESKEPSNIYKTHSSP